MRSHHSKFPGKDIHGGLRSIGEISDSVVERLRTETISRPTTGPAPTHGGQRRRKE